MTPSTSLLVTPIEMMQVLEGILLRNGFGADASTQLATVFTQNSVDGIYSHGINRFATFIEHKQKVQKIKVYNANKLFFTFD
jgi:3-dehydro-L-gulonate 2-dehydrogenase